MFAGFRPALLLRSQVENLRYCAGKKLRWVTSSQTADFVADAAAECHSARSTTKAVLFVMLTTLQVDTSKVGQTFRFAFFGEANLFLVFVKHLNSQS